MVCMGPRPFFLSRSLRARSCIVAENTIAATDTIADTYWIPNGFLRDNKKFLYEQFAFVPWENLECLLPV